MTPETVAITGRWNRPRGADDLLHDDHEPPLRRRPSTRCFDDVNRRFDDTARQNDAAHAEINASISEIKGDFRALITRPGSRARPDGLIRPRCEERAYGNGGQTLAYRNSPFTLLLRYPPGDSAVLNSS